MRSTPVSTAGWRGGARAEPVAVTTEILATWRHPRRAVARQLAGPQQEGRALVILILACVLVFVGQLPLSARLAALDPSVPLEARIGAGLLAWLMIAPLLFYLLAGLLRLVLAARRPGAGFRVRMAMFWGFLAAAPLWMLNGLTLGMLGQGAAATLVGLGALAATLWFWVQGLREALTPIAPNGNPA